MNCTFCGMPGISTGKRERQKTSLKACEQLQQLQEARLRIRLLERVIRRSGLTLPTQTKSVGPVELWEFVSKHNVARTLVQGVIEQKMLRPTAGEHDSLMLDVQGQCSFWQLFHDAGPWQACPDCPHDEDLFLE
jgi:hypothetical protein